MQKPKPNKTNKEFYDSHKTFLLDISKYSLPPSLTSPPANYAEESQLCDLRPLGWPVS